MRQLILITMISSFVACSSNESKKELKNDEQVVVDHPTEAKVTKKNTVNDINTFDLGTKYILIVTPDSTEIENLKKEYGEKDFYVLADDRNAEEVAAIDFLKSRSMSFSTTKKRFVKLKTNHKWNHTDHPIREMLVDTDTLESRWIVIMNGGYDPPIFSTLVDVPKNFEQMEE